MGIADWAARQEERLRGNPIGRTFVNVGNLAASSIPGKPGDKPRAEARRLQNQAAERAGGSGAAHTFASLSAPRTRSEANWEAPFLVAGAVARPAGKLFRVLTKADDVATTSRGINPVTARQGAAEVRAATSAVPSAPLAGRTTMGSPWVKPLVAGGVVVGATTTAPVWLGGLGEGISRLGSGVGSSLQDTFSGAGQGVGAGLAGVGGGFGQGLAGAGQGVGQGIQGLAGPVLLIGGALLVGVFLGRRK